MRRGRPKLPGAGGGALESRFDAAFTTELALREKQIQQSYRPVIGVHKWFARRPGTVFRALMLAEFGGDRPLREAFWEGHALSGLIADPFMGGGTPVYEANRLGFSVIGCDINPMAHWIVRQSLTPLDLDAFAREAARVIADVERELGGLYRTRCESCRKLADVKYFLWVKVVECPGCGEANDLFPGYRVAEAVRHPKHVLACSACGALSEYHTPPTKEAPGACPSCDAPVHVEGNVHRRRVRCRKCVHEFALSDRDSPPDHRMWAIEYRCGTCYPAHEGRQFKSPDAEDLARSRRAARALDARGGELPIPDDTIPRGDETDRLHRWGYRRYREMFGPRQLLGLGVLLRRILAVDHREIRDALLTVFSDTLRYQNMLCRYDTYALKCQDIFSVHGFPVGLVQCENSLLGIDGAGSGSFRHFVEKYARAKAYCAAPFETRHSGRRKEIVPTTGETISATFVERVTRDRSGKQAILVNRPSQTAPLGAAALDGVFTDPPYFDNVQYAELIDFCYVWLRRALATDHPEFVRASTRSPDELTGNATLGRSIAHFTEGLSEVFVHFARALKPNAPFVFTYHHNDAGAYIPLIVAILDAGLECTATLPAAAEMSASLHISGTGSSILDSVFVCRAAATGVKHRASQQAFPIGARDECRNALAHDVGEMTRAGVRVSPGDVRCLLAGHVARLAMRTLRPAWDATLDLETRMGRARLAVDQLTRIIDVPATITGAVPGAQLGGVAALGECP